MKKTKPLYYKFWLKSSRGTDQMTLRLYYSRPDAETLKRDVEEWATHFGAWVVSENICHYGHNELKRLPKTRKQLVDLYVVACKRHKHWSERVKMHTKLLSLPPFNGKKLLGNASLA